jgi:vancomycin resistance protein YoaR
VAAVLLILLFGGFMLFDGAMNFGKIHKGVMVGDIDVGGLTKAEAADKLNRELGGRVSTSPIDLFDDETNAKFGATDNTVVIDNIIGNYDGHQSIQGSHSWRITAVTVGAFVDGEALADEAYGVGRGGDFFIGRPRASFFGVTIEGAISYDPAQLQALEHLLTGTLGEEPTDAGIAFTEGTFTVTSADDGYGVDHAAFVTNLDTAFLGEQRYAVVPMVLIPVTITNETARLAADKVNTAIASPIALVYENADSWSVDGETLGSWVTTRIEGEGDLVQLVPQVTADSARTGVNAIIGERDPGIAAQNARFQIVDNVMTIVPSVDGSGIDYAKVASDLNAILFEEPNAVRKISLAVTTLSPARSTADLESMNINHKIAEFKSEYPTASVARTTNIHLASDLISYSLIEPDGTWSFNAAAGECTPERGFQVATAFVGDQIVDEIGGGVCQVATTVYNVFYDAGLPIVERTAHMFYMKSYPDGRDAAVYWPGPDLILGNDTGNWILLTMSYTDNSVTATLWGVDPGYTVETTTGEWIEGEKFKTREVENKELPAGARELKQEGVNGRRIQVTRIVYNNKGEVLREAVFKSNYAAQPEIYEIGPKEE